MLVVHRNQLKPCLTPPQLPSDTVTAQHLQTTNCVPSYADVVADHNMSQARGYTSVEPDHPTTQSTRAQRPPARYNDYLHYKYLVRIQELGKEHYN